jgi:hypothetical protein
MTQAATVRGSESRTARDRHGPGVLRKVGVGITSALLAGAALGALARLMMRLTALAAGEPAHFSLGGSAVILLAFVVFALPGAILAAVVRRRGRSALLVLAALALCVPAAGAASAEVTGVATLSGPALTGVVLSTAGVFVSILALPWLTLRLVSHGLGGRG